MQVCRLILYNYPNFADRPLENDFLILLHSSGVLHRPVITLNYGSLLCTQL
jgi:hypothetical protein